MIKDYLDYLSASGQALENEVCSFSLLQSLHNFSINTDFRGMLV